MSEQNEQQNNQKQDEHQNQPPKKNIYKGLDEKYQRAIDYRLRGFTHDAIALFLTKLQWKTQGGTVRQWFTEGGLCHDVYEKLLAKRREEAEKELAIVQDTLKDGIADALSVLSMGALQGEISDSQFRAIENLLDRGGLPRKASNDANANINTQSGAEIASALNTIANAFKTLPKVAEVKPTEPAKPVQQPTQLNNG